MTAETESLPGSNLISRRRWVLMIAAGAALLSTGGVVGAWYVKSPAQLAADTAPPTASVLTAPVVSQVLSSTVVLRGDISDGNVVSVTPSSAAATEAMPGSVNPEVSNLVVTKVTTQVGQPVDAAHPLVEVSGRPVFALPGSIPAYRDLLPGETGPDVAQLQDALRKLGYSSAPDVPGEFGSGTEAALTKLYSAMGYPVPISVAQNGPMLPMSEVVFVPSLPAHVVSLPIAVGGTVKGPVITLSTGELGLTGYLDPSDQGLVKPGMRVRIDSESTGASAAGTVVSIGNLVTPGDGAAASANLNGGVPFLPLTVAPAGTWNPLLAGQNVRITITTARTAQAVLTVPEAAIADGADATTAVTVVAADGSQHRIPVLAGTSANGEVQVTPVAAGALTAGENVEIGK